MLAKDFSHFIVVIRKILSELFHIFSVKGPMIKLLCYEATLLNVFLHIFIVLIDDSFQP
jgi:hypothetical protein